MLTLPTELPKEITDKYSIENNTFIQVAKDDPKDFIQAEIGDIKQTDFVPQVKIQRWDNEVNCSIRLKDSEIGTPQISADKDKIIWTKGNITARFYDLIEGDGGYEFQIDLASKPKTNKIEFTLNTKGLDFLYQPELTQEEKNKGDLRPENVVGSYAVYTSENKRNYVDGKKYKCSKVGHIFRPKIIDNAGNETWGILNIENGILSVEIPQKFLDEAIYPIRHAAGLTFGYTSFGVSSYTVYDRLECFKVSSPADYGSFVSLSLGGDTGNNYKGVIVLQADKNIIANGVSNPVSGNSSAFVTTTFGTNPTLIASTGYYLGIVGDSGSSARFDTGDAGDGFSDSTNSYSSPTNPTDGSASNRRISIYITYLEAGGVPVKIEKSLKYCVLKEHAAIEKSLKYDIFLGATGIQKSLQYVIDLGLPEVTTQAVDDIEKTTAMGHGTIVS